MCARDCKLVRVWVLGGRETTHECKILFMPLGPNVLLTRSPMAMAPTKEDSLAFSDFSIVASSLKRLAA